MAQFIQASIDNAKRIANERASRPANPIHEPSEDQLNYDPIAAQSRQMQAWDTPEKFANAMLPQEDVNEQARLNTDAQNRQTQRQTRMGFKNDPAMQAAMDRRVSQGFQSDIARYRRQLKSEQPMAQARLADSIEGQATGAYMNYWKQARRKAGIAANEEAARKRKIGQIIAGTSMVGGAVVGGIFGGPMGAQKGAQAGYASGQGFNEGAGLNQEYQDVE